MPPTPDDASIEELLVHAARTLRHRWAAAVEPWDLSPHQARALRVIGTEGGLRLSDLARGLRIAPRSATEVVDALAERDLVERVRDTRDRRAVLLRLTEDGRRTRTEVERVRAELARAQVERLDEAERAELARLLRRLLDDGPG